ncbi:MAG TPA: YjgN family protein [Roseateles sp.]
MQEPDAAPAAAIDALPRAPRVLEIRFTGSGSEYFRIWAVNLLLILVTLGFYLPFAKARRIRYFYANTLIDGQALSFHGDAWKMFRGFVLLVVLFGLYVGLGAVSPLLGGLAFVALLLLWPPLWRAGMRFRLTHTSWRGLRFGFSGSVGGAYKVFLPVSVPLVLLMTVPEDAGMGLRSLAGVAALAFNFMLPWTLGLAKRYQHNHYRYAQQQARTWLEPSQVYGLSFRAGFMGGVAVLIAGVVAAVVLPTLRGSSSWLPIAGVGLVYFAAWVWVSSAFTAGLQNLAWSRTASESILFKSDLETMELARLTLTNWLLMALTLGLYRPFAAVATARLRLQAVTVETTADINGWAGDEAAQNPDAAGDFAGDFFGIDLGL